MNSVEEESSANSTERLNYFNYFTEVEEEFVRRRGKPLLVSPMDWALIESWQNAGIPLHIVIRAINRAFDAYDARPRKFRKVNSVFYCQQEVESTFADYRLSQVGGDPAGSKEKPQKQQKDKSSKQQEIADAFPKRLLLDFLARSESELSGASALAASANRTEIESAIERARARLIEMAREVEISAQSDAEAIERDLDAIDRMILRSATESCGQEGVEKIRAEAESQLQPYRKKMDKAIYQQTVQNFISRRLREMNNIPRLSLFYL